MPKQVPLTQGLFALVDDEDFEAVSQKKWNSFRGGRSIYATTDRGKTTLHRFILGDLISEEIDHINGNGLDNRRQNLRGCTHKQNLRNRRKQLHTLSRFKGVTKTASGKWRAGIQADGIKLSLGSFKSEIAAAQQYDRAARIFFGPFAKTNEMLGLYEAPDIIYLHDLSKENILHCG